MATAAVEPDPIVWAQKACTEAYEPCYKGCSDCSDPSYAWTACSRTAAVKAAGTLCDANSMWNWGEEAKYPAPCLAALGEQYRNDALEALRRSYHDQLAIIMLTVLAGLVGGFVTYVLWRRATERCIRRPPAAEETSDQRRRRRRRCRGSLRTLLPASLLALFPRTARAYACTGQDAAAERYFVNANRTLAVRVHGWFSDCQEVKASHHHNFVPPPPFPPL